MTALCIRLLVRWIHQGLNCSVRVYNSSNLSYQIGSGFITSSDLTIPSPQTYSADGNVTRFVLVSGNLSVDITLFRDLVILPFPSEDVRNLNYLSRDNITIPLYDDLVWLCTIHSYALTLVLMGLSPR